MGTGWGRERCRRAPSSARAGIHPGAAVCALSIWDVASGGEGGGEGKGDAQLLVLLHARG